MQTTMGIKRPLFKGYVRWYHTGEENGVVYPPNGEYHIREWLLNQLPFEIAIRYGVSGLTNIGNSVEGKWSAYVSSSDFKTHYFFESETDAMAFKLRWI